MRIPFSPPVCYNTCVKAVLSLIKFSLKTILGFIIFTVLLGSLLVAAFSALFFIEIRKERTLTPSELSAESCSELPTLSQVDSIFLSHQATVSALLNELRTCENNKARCRGQKECVKEDYDNRRVRTGNTIIEWGKVSGCGGQDRGALYVSYTSACEGIMLNNFMDRNPELDRIPAKYNNY